MKPHKHAELIKAWADGAEIQFKDKIGYWHDVICPKWDEEEYRIKPEPKPDVVTYLYYSESLNRWYEIPEHVPIGTKEILHLIRDAETGKLKDAKVMK
jgi:hypothetical protein